MIEKNLYRKWIICEMSKSLNNDNRLECCLDDRWIKFIVI